MTVIDGKYELLEVAGRGGMATVWRGSTIGAAGFKRPVAIKRILSFVMQDRQFVEMFIEEARVGSQLQHPNIVQIHDFGEEESGRYFLVMEWIEGLDLGRYLRAFRAAGEVAPWPLTCAICIEVLRGLDAAHGRSEGPIFHRDVNPQNIMLDISGVVKLTDFGLARAMDRGRMTNPDIIKGKLSYMAPELTYGKDASIQSDLYSVGVVLWEAIAGCKLISGETDADVFLGARSADVPPLTEHRSDVPAELCEVVDRALCRFPAGRYESADEMGRDLAALLRGVEERTDAAAVGRSVVEARARLERLAAAPAPPPPNGARRR